MWNIRVRQMGACFVMSLFVCVYNCSMRCVIDVNKFAAASMYRAALYE